MQGQMERWRWWLRATKVMLIFFNCISSCEGVKKELYVVLDLNVPCVLETKLAIGPNDLVLEERGRIISEDGGRMTGPRKELVNALMEEVNGGYQVLLKRNSKVGERRKNMNEKKKKRLIFLGRPLVRAEEVDLSPPVVIEVKKQGMRNFEVLKGPSRSSSSRVELKKLAQLVAIVEVLSRLTYAIHPKWWDKRNDDETNALLNREERQQQWVDKGSGRRLPDWAKGVHRNDGFPVYLLQGTQITKIPHHDKITNGSSTEVIPLFRVTLRVLTGTGKGPACAELVRREVEMINSELLTTHVESLRHFNVAVIRVKRPSFDIHVSIRQRGWNQNRYTNLFKYDEVQMKRMMAEAMGVSSVVTTENPT